MVDKMSEILEVTLPRANCQADFFRVRSAVGRTPHAHCSPISNMSLDCCLNNLTPDTIKVMITIKILDKVDVRLRENTL